ncbi:hypothetical protein AB0J20_17085 [Micromonospora costi]|uniref:WXG100 family type VII secretion target n=1 Tax=Micromonospora costi TaxID=1530042 RepID=UPI0033DB99EF
MENLHVDIDSLRRGAEQLEQAKETVREAFEGFQAAVEGYADAFGGDDIGTLLAVAHSACVEAATECFGTNVSELETYVDGLLDMADNYQSVEDGIAAAFSRMLGSLGG